MIKWIYKDKEYTIYPIFLEEDIKLLTNIITQRKVVYNINGINVII